MADVARANLLAAERASTGPLNMGTGVETDVNRLYQVLADAAGVRAAAEPRAGEAGEQRRSCLDAARRRGARWAGAPRSAIEDGLRRGRSSSSGRSRRWRAA